MPFSSSVLGTLAPLKLCHGYACPSQALSWFACPFQALPRVRLPFSSSVFGTLAVLKLCDWYACPFQALSWVRLPYSSSATGVLAPLKPCHEYACSHQASPQVFFFPTVPLFCLFFVLAFFLFPYLVTSLFPARPRPRPLLPFALPLRSDHPMWLSKALGLGRL